MGSSHQKGWVRLRGKKWYGYFRRTELDPATDEPKPVIAQVILGLKSEMSKFQAREKLESEIARLGGQSTGDRSMINGAVTFGWFVRNRYLPLKEGDWREETAKVKKHIIEADLVDEFGDVRLENIDKFALQTHLNKLAKTRSKDRVLQIRTYMRAIFGEAADQDFLAKDPARSVRIPAHLRETDKTTLTWDQLRAALSKLGLRDRILLELDMSNALRPGELFGLRWKCFDPAVPSITIMETTYKGKIRPWGKTRGSLTTTPIATELAAELVEWKKLSKDPSPEAFIFPNRIGGFLDSSNFRNRVLHKLAEELELPKLTFQVIRRTIATLAQKKGTVKDVQGILRHSRTATTTDVYMQELPEGVRATVNSIHRELKTGTGGGGAVATSRSTQSTAKPASAGPESETRVVEMPVTRNELKSGKLKGASEMRDRKNSEPSSTKVLRFAANLLPSTKGGEPLKHDWTRTSDLFRVKVCSNL
jgi:integrase